MQNCENGGTDDLNSWSSKDVDIVKGFLRQGPKFVTFTKADGTLREMKCTLHPDYLPVFEEKESLETKTPRKSNPNQIRVYDLEKEAWRSFNIESVVNIHG